MQILDGPCQSSFLSKCDNFLSIYVSRVLTEVLRRETVIANTFTMRSASVQDISDEAVVSLNFHFILINKIGLESFLSSTLHIFRHRSYQCMDFSALALHTSSSAQDIEIPNMIYIAQPSVIITTIKI